VFTASHIAPAFSPRRASRRRRQLSRLARIARTATATAPPPSSKRPVLARARMLQAPEQQPRRQRSRCRSRTPGGHEIMMLWRDCSLAEAAARARGGGRSPSPHERAPAGADLTLAFTIQAGAGARVLRHRNRASAPTARDFCLRPEGAAARRVGRARSWLRRSQPSATRLLAQPARAGPAANVLTAARPHEQTPTSPFAPLLVWNERANCRRRHIRLLLWDHDAELRARPTRDVPPSPGGIALDLGAYALRAEIGNGWPTVGFSRTPQRAATPGRRSSPRRSTASWSRMTW